MPQENNTDNYYTLLNCEQTASHEELKQSYQDLIRKYHPDKCDGSSEIFLNIDKAWKTLRDENSRHEYDLFLQRQSYADNVMIYLKLKKNELVFGDGDVATFSCRCGSHFTIQKDEVGEEDYLVECDECSNCVLIT